MSEERHRPGTAMYIRDGQILRSDAAREAKAIKDAEDVVREVLDDPEYQLSRERSSQGYSQNEEKEEGLTENELKIIIKKEGSKESVTKDIVKDKNDLEEEKQKGMCAECTAGGSISKKSTVQKEGISQAKETKDTAKAKKSVVRAKEKTDKARINLSDQSTRERMKYTHGKEAQNDVKNESSSDESVTKPGKSQHIVVRSKEVSTSNAVNLHNVRAEVMNQPYQRANSKWEKDQRNPEVVGVQEAYTAKAEVSHSQGEAKALNAQVKAMKVEVAAEAAVRQCNVKVSALEANVTGVETGATAKAECNDTSFSAKALNINVTGVNAKVTAEAKLNTGIAVDTGNVEVMGVGTVGAEVNADARTGLAVGNVKCGVTGKSGISVSTRPSAFNVNATIGPPSLSVGLGLNLGVPFLSGGSEITSAESQSDNNDDNNPKGGGITAGTNDANIHSGSGHAEPGYSMYATGGNGHAEREIIRTGSGVNNGTDGDMMQVQQSNGSNQSNRSDFTPENHRLHTEQIGAGGNGVTETTLTKVEAMPQDIQRISSHSVDFEHKGNIEHGYWTQYIENGDQYWVSLEETDDNELLGFMDESEPSDIGRTPGISTPRSGRRSQQGEAYSRKMDPVEGQVRIHPSTGIGTGLSDYQSQQEQQDTHMQVDQRSRHMNTGEGHLPRLPQSPFLVNQGNNDSEYDGDPNNDVTITKVSSKKSLKGSKVTSGSHKTGEHRKNQLDHFDQMVLNMVHREVKGKLEPEETSSKPVTNSKTEKKFDRDTMKANLINNLKPKVKKHQKVEGIDIGGKTGGIAGGGVSLSSNSDSVPQSCEEPKPQSAKKGKPFGANKNIHGFHTLGGTSSKPLKQLGRNIVGFGN